MKLQDLSNMKFGRWTVLRKADTKSNQTKWLCKCNCGTVKEINASTLKNGQSTSCGCYRKEAVSKFQKEDLTGQRFGYLYVEKLDHIAKNRQCVWRCRCICGQETNVYASNLKRGHTLSCGCIGTSYNENEIAKELNILNVKFEREYKFDDLIGVNGGQLLFDFAIKDNHNNVIGLIEYQGEQHRYVMKNDPHFGQYQREYSDNAKKNYCKLHNIPLYEIWFDEDIINSLKTILENIFKNHVDSVPNVDCSTEV